MTERKPPGMAFESWVERQIHDAQQRGEFDGLAGTGKPLPCRAEDRDEHWWIKQKLEHEGITGDMLLPPSLQLRKETERLGDTVRGLPAEQDVREVVRELNWRIAEWLRAPSEPYVPVRPVNEDKVVRRWRADPARRRPGVSTAVPPRAAGTRAAGARTTGARTTGGARTRGWLRGMIDAAGRHIAQWR